MIGVDVLHAFDPTSWHWHLADGLSAPARRAPDGHTCVALHLRGLTQSHEQPASRTQLLVPARTVSAARCSIYKSWTLPVASSAVGHALS